MMLRMTTDAPKDRTTNPTVKAGGGWVRTVGLLLVLGAIAVHGIWSIVESHLLNKRISAIRAAGEPVLPEDFAVLNVDASDNAVKQLLDAARTIKHDDDAWRDFANLEPAFPLRPDEVKTIDAIVGRSGAAIDRVADAQKLSRMDWPRFNMLSDSDNEVFGDVRKLANVLGAAVMSDHQRGDDRAALQHVRQIMFIARIMDRHPSLVGHLVAVGVHAIAVNKILQVAPDLQIRANETNTDIQSMRDLIGELLDDRAIRDGFTRGFVGERMTGLELSQNMVLGNKSGPGPLVARYVMKPVINHNSRTLLDYETSAIPLGNLPNWPAAKSAVPTKSQGSSLNLFAQILEPAFDRAIEHHFRIMTDQHLAAAALALRWYANDHDGKLPATLDELVPQYLPAGPRDLMSAGDKPILFHGGDDQIVYSVGSNATDDGGSEKLLPTSRGEFNEWTRLDRVVHVKRQPRNDEH